MDNTKYKYKEIKITSTISTEALLKQLGNIVLVPSNQNENIE